MAAPTPFPAQQPTSVFAPPTSDAVPPAGGAAATPVPQATVAPAPAAPTEVPAPSGVLGDAAVPAAVDRVASEPPSEGLPARDVGATTRLETDLLRAGHDLTGLELAVFPPTTIGSFVVIETNDSTALLSSDAGENFIFDLLGAPALTEEGVERLVLQHSGVDDQGAFRVTMTIGIAEFQNAIDTGADVFSLFAVQMERP